MTTAYQHRCTLQVTAHCGGPKPGKPTRKRCAACGGGFVVTEGLYGVFVHRGDGDYRTADARSLHARPSAAEREAAKDPRLVVRFVSPPSTTQEAGQQ